MANYVTERPAILRQWKEKMTHSPIRDAEGKVVPFPHSFAQIESYLPHVLALMDVPLGEFQTQLNAEQIQILQELQILPVLTSVKHMLRKSVYRERASLFAQSDEVQQTPATRRFRQEVKAEGEGHNTISTPEIGSDPHSSVHLSRVRRYPRGSTAPRTSTARRARTRRLKSPRRLRCP